jgi:hypothetical protein
MKRHIVPVLVLGLVVASCSEKVADPQVPPDTHGAPQRVTVAGAELVLETYLVRDFMPFAPPDGHPLRAVLQVRSVNGAPLPAGLTMPGAVVYFGKETWQSTPEIIPTSDPGLLMGNSSDGPKWGPGVTADVVVTLDLDGQQTRLGAAGQPIERTD